MFHKEKKYIGKKFQEETVGSTTIMFVMGSTSRETFKL